MRRGGPTRLGAGLIVLIMAVVIIGALVWAGRTFLGNNNSGGGEAEIDYGQQLLDEPTETTAVRMSVRGPITAQENHYSIALTISSTARNLTIWRSYDGSVMTSENLTNSAASFNDLLAALNRASYMKEARAEEENQGICAVGQLINFEIFEYQTDDQGETTEKLAKKLWTTSCNGLTGSFNGLTPNVIDLFLGQIPDARNRISAAKSVIDQENRASIGSPWEGLDAFK